jgi:5'-3' exonuclease
MLNSGEDPSAFAAAVSGAGDAFDQTWASGLFRDPSLGAAWDATGPNIPGAGIGRKAAAALIREHGGLEALLNNLDRVKCQRSREKLMATRDQILQNRKMVELECSTELPVSLDALKIAPDYPALLEALEKCEFKSLLQEVRDEASKAGTARQSELLL